MQAGRLFKELIYGSLDASTRINFAFKVPSVETYSLKRHFGPLYEPKKRTRKIRTKFILELPPSTPNGKPSTMSISRTIRLSSSTTNQEVVRWGILSAGRISSDFTKAMAVAPTATVSYFIPHFMA